MQKADLECGPYTACYEPTTVDPVVWSLPEVLAWLVIAALIIWLIWALLQPVKPEPTLKEAVRKAVLDAQTEAGNWQDQKAVNLLTRTWDKIDGEFNKRS